MGKCFYSGPDACKAKYVYKLARCKLARFVRIISGHNSLFYFCSKVDPDINPVCRFCQEEDETFFHLVNNCPRFFETRREILLDTPVSNNMQWSVQQLIDFSYTPGVNGALEGDTHISLYRVHEDLLDEGSSSEGGSDAAEEDNGVM